MIYNWGEYPYQINDAAIDCGMMLLTTCDPYIHEYVDPCSVVSDCLDNLWRPAIDRCEMVAEIPWAAPWAFLRIDNTWNCVEFIDPTAVFSAYNTDEMVAVDSMDSAGYLEDKIISTDGSIIVSNTGSALDLSSAAVDSFIWLSDTPSSYTGHDWDILKVSWNELMFVTDDKSQRGVSYLADDENWTWAINNVDRHFLATSYYEWNPSIPGSEWYSLGTAYYMEVQKDWMYNVWFNGWVIVNRWVNAVKMALLAWISWDKRVLLNSKLGVRPSGMPIVDEDRGEDNFISSFSEKGLVKLTAGTRLYLMIRVDSNAWNNIVPEITIEGKTHVAGTFASGSGETFAHKYCGTLMGMSRYSDITHNAA